MACRAASKIHPQSPPKSTPKRVLRGSGRISLNFIEFSPFWGAAWGRLGAVSGRPGEVLGPSWGRFGASWGVLGASLGFLEPAWGVLELSWGVLGPRRGFKSDF